MGIVNWIRWNLVKAYGVSLLTAETAICEEVHRPLIPPLGGTSLEPQTRPPRLSARDGGQGSQRRISFFIAADPPNFSGTGIPAMKNHSAAEAAVAEAHAKGITEMCIDLS